MKTSVNLSSSNQSTPKGLILGLYETEASEDIHLTKSASKFQECVATNLTDLIQISGLKKKKGEVRVFYGLCSDYPSVAVVNLGKEKAGFNICEQLNEQKENVRIAVAAGVKKLHSTGVKDIDVDSCGDAQSAAEASSICCDVYDDLKCSDKRKPAPNLSLFTQYADDADSLLSSWNKGMILGEAQNLSRRLMEAPANLMTPTIFSDVTVEKLSSIGCEVLVRDEEWAELNKMGCFLSVTRGSAEPPKFLEIKYSGASNESAPFALVGKGVTFDSGGISIKPSAKMDEMRADMGGAACVVGCLLAVAKLKLPINVMGFIPLCENMPGEKATKPGDVVTSMNGKTVQVDNTDAEGRLILSDALCYAQTFKPTGIIDLATLTGAMVVALGSAATGVFSNSETLWETIQKAGVETGDRMWRMPLMKHYTKQITDCKLADLNNIGGGRAGGSCTAAAFLQEFVTSDSWMHLDIAGVMTNASEVPYVPSGMSGRPTRTLVEFLTYLSQDQS